MNLKENPTKDELKIILGACKNNEAHHIIWVDHEGNVMVTPLPKNLTPAGFEKQNEERMKFRLETISRENESVGMDAANDDEWVDHLFNALNDLWISDFNGYCNSY